MTDYRAVMDQVLKGWSVRQICSNSRCSHTTVQKAVSDGRIVAQLRRLKSSPFSCVSYSA